MLLSGSQIIASTFQVSDGPAFSAVNPASGALLQPQFHEALGEHADRAAVAAAEAAGSFRRLPLPLRAAFLEEIGTQLTAIGADLIGRAHEETALPQARLEGELARTVNQLRLFAEQVRRGKHLDVRIDRAMPHRLPTAKPDLRTTQVPIGPVAVFGASNFPLAFSVAGGDTASALAAGCPVVVKAHPAHPGTSELAGRAVARAVQQHNMPPGVFSLLQAQQMETGMSLVRHPQVKAVAFTGSLAGGRALFDLAASRPEPIPVFAEMGSVNPVFLLPYRIAEQGTALAAALADSLTLGVGQFCTAPGLVLVVASPAADAFLGELTRNLEAKAAGVMLHAGIKRSFLAHVRQRAAQQGVSSCLQPQSDLEGCLVTPVLLRTEAETLIANPALAEEVFGPAAIVVSCASVDKMLAAAESLRGQLTATVHGTRQDFTDVPELIELIERKAGRLVVNGFPTGVEVCAAMHHGGPYPATTDSRFTSVGTAAVKRFLRPVCYQNCPQELLPEELRDANQQGLWRLVDGRMSRADL